MTTDCTGQSRIDAATGLTNATGSSYSDRPTVDASLRNRLLNLPGNTVVRTGHGEDTTVAAERPNVPTP
ncbi:hypothetical protein ACFWP7_34630 [Streptomyces sp. NPDC058470]|uniref:hypothetical protein n=1 Tax=Streptomyces sp. NPDC058470 TaxID=3346515 RepID=UPI00365C11BC